MFRLNFFGLGVYGGEPVIHSWCSELLRMEYFREIRYFGVEDGVKAPSHPDVKCGYSKNHSNFLLRRILFFILVFRTFAGRNISDSRNVVIYFPGCSVLRFFVSDLIVYVPTLSVAPDKLRRSMYDCILCSEIQFFNSVITLTDALANKLNHRNVNVVPLGSREFKVPERGREVIEVLYVGTLFNREIPSLLVAIEILLRADEDVRFTMIGRGCDSTARKVRQFIHDNDFSGRCKFLGEIHPPEVNVFFERSHIGISYVPQTAYFDLQPVTKIAEYAAAGMYTVATRTAAQMSMIDEAFGICVEANPVEFADGILSAVQRIRAADIGRIHEYAEQFLYRNIVQHHLGPALQLRIGETFTRGGGE